MSAYDDSLPPDEKHDPGAHAPLDPDAREIQEQLDEHERAGIVAPHPESERDGAPEDGVEEPEGQPGRGGD